MSQSTLAAVEANITWLPACCFRWRRFGPTSPFCSHNRQRHQTKHHNHRFSTLNQPTQYHYKSSASR